MQHLLIRTHVFTMLQQQVGTLSHLRLFSNHVTRGNSNVITQRVELKKGGSCLYKSADLLFQLSNGLEAWSFFKGSKFFFSSRRQRRHSRVWENDRLRKELVELTSSLDAASLPQPGELRIAGSTEDEQNLLLGHRDVVEELRTATGKVEDYVDSNLSDSQGKSLGTPLNSIDRRWQEWLAKFQRNASESSFSPKIRRKPKLKNSMGHEVSVKDYSAFESKIDSLSGGERKWVDQAENDDLKTEDYDFKEGDLEELFSHMNQENRSKPVPNFSHDEAMMMQEAYSKKKLADQRIRWLKARGLQDPEKTAKRVLSEIPDHEDHLVDSIGGISCRQTAALKRMVAEDECQEVASRIRAKIREEKLENAKLMKKSLPNVRGQVLDPIKFHVAKRVVRMNALLKSQLEELLTWNSADVLFGSLGGASVSIHHVCQATTRSVCYVYFTIASNHDPDDVEKKLNAAAPHFRFQLARRLELGFTPPFKFVYFVGEDKFFRQTNELRRGAHRTAEKQRIIADSWTGSVDRNR